MTYIIYCNLVIKKLWNKTAVRYCVIGGASYLFELIILFSLVKGLSLQRTVATGIAFWFGLISAFIFQKIFAFKDYSKEVKTLSKQSVAYGILVIWNYVFTLAVVSLMPKEYLLFSRTLALIITTLWNYFIYKHLIFGKKSLKQILFNLIKNIYLKRKAILFVIVATTPILIYSTKLLLTSKRVFWGDFDYYAQMYEAMRISILKYHQFPSWNPWIAGGLPLYANPQFGLLSLQSVLVLIFGTIYGLKLSYVTYMILGFWGMYVFCKSTVQANRLRSVLVSYLWVFCGFYAYRSISHFTFTSLFLLPWLFYFITIRTKKFAWLGLGITMSVILLSSVHYPFLYSLLALSLFFIILMLKPGNISGFKRASEFINLRVSKKDIIFIAKAISLTIILAGYRVITTVLFVTANERAASMLVEPPVSLTTLFTALFVPVGNRFIAMPANHLTWSWGEYSMYMGFGTSLAFAFCIAILLYNLFKKRFIMDLKNNWVLTAILIVGFFGSMLAIGSIFGISPYDFLRKLPGYSQMRVPSRFAILTAFAILVFLAWWKKQNKLINLLLILAVIELLVGAKPLQYKSFPTIDVSSSTYNNTFTTYDNGQQHLDMMTNPEHSYFNSTRQNRGQIYADDSLINTLNNVIGTSKCGENINPKCDLVLSDNAIIEYWSPNKIILKRTSPGQIILNMNTERGWKVNEKYIFLQQKSINPVINLTLPEGSDNYTLKYSPKLSPSWIIFKLSSL